MIRTIPQPQKSGKVMLVQDSDQFAISSNPSDAVPFGWSLRGYFDSVEDAKEWVEDWRAGMDLLN